jgi:hypothetical protein
VEFVEGVEEVEVRFRRFILVAIERCISVVWML